MSVAELASSLPRPARASELQAVLKAERTGSPFVVHRDADGTLCILRLTGERARQTIGRRGSNDIALPWDDQVSRVHAELERIGDCWAVADDGLSTNGTFLNGSRVGARRRLRDGDCIRVGSSVLLFRDPAQDAGSLASLDTHRAVLPAVPDHVSPVQRRVLMALCRPYKNGSGFTAPATNQQIAAEVFLSVDRVKAHLRILFEKFGVTELPQNRKRLELVQRALLSGLVTLGDL